MTKKFDKKISDAQFEVQPSADFVDRVMRDVKPARFAWLRPYAFAVPVFVLLLVAIPTTRNRILNEMYPERVVASSVDEDLNEINQLLNDLRSDFADTQLENLSE